jgi:hypothetical protein
VIVGVLSMAVASVFTYGGGLPIGPGDRAASVLAEQHVMRLGAELFGPHLIAVEVAGVLLLAALVGAAVIVAHSKAPLAPPGSQPVNPAAGGATSPTGDMPTRATEL